MADEAQAFLFFFNRWRSSKRVLRMSFKERGMYLELLIDQWEAPKHSLPDDPALLAKSIGATATEFVKNWPTLRANFATRRDGRLVNLFLERVRGKWNAKRRAKQNAGRAGGLAKARRKPQSTEPLAASGAIAPLSSASPLLSYKEKNIDSKEKHKEEKAPDSRSPRPIFSGQRFAVFEWQLGNLAQMLGPHLDAFDLHAWFFQLDAQVAASPEIIPRRDSGAWLEGKLLAEAKRRGLTVAVIDQSGKPPRRADVGGYVREAWTCAHEPKCGAQRQCQLLTDLAAARAERDARATVRA